MPRMPGRQVPEGLRPVTRSEVVRDIGTGARHRVNALEVARPPQVGPETFLQLEDNLVGITQILLRQVLGDLGDSRLRRVPIARPVLVQLGRCRREPAQRVPEDLRRLARHH